MPVLDGREGSGGNLGRAAACDFVKREEASRSGSKLLEPCQVVAQDFALLQVAGMLPSAVMVMAAMPNGSLAETETLILPWWTPPLCIELMETAEGAVPLRPDRRRTGPFRCLWGNSGRNGDERRPRRF
jgi:hypothetical protein